MSTILYHYLLPVGREHYLAQYNKTGLFRRSSMTREGWHRYSDTEVVDWHKSGRVDIRQTWSTVNCGRASYVCLGKGVGVIQFERRDGEWCVIGRTIPVFLIYVVRTGSRGYVRCVWSRNVSDASWCPRQRCHEVGNAFRYSLRHLQIIWQIIFKSLSLNFGEVIISP